MDYGVIEYDAEGKLQNLVEKPIYSYNFGMGVNVINSNSASKFLEKDKYLDMPDLMMNMKDDGSAVYCYQEDCFWLDMGVPEEYEKANQAFEERKEDFLPSIYNKKD